MTMHLTPRHLVDAIEDTLAPAETHHLRECTACQAEVARLRAVLDEVESAAPAPNPSPLFWDHFGDRVRRATAELPIEGPSWWAGWWRPVALAGAALAVVALAVLVRPTPSVEPVETTLANVEPLPSLDGEGWDLVLSLADDLAWEEVRQVATPRRGMADMLIDELSAEERAAFVKLLKQEMGGLE